ncbi:hypothetical protein C8255_01925 [filamentous cyanobacterium CCP3]|nr:hypothetical protein C8255_01925 [filamentous cyanobacterium CCP3]
MSLPPKTTPRWPLWLLASTLLLLLVLAGLYWVDPRLLDLLPAALGYSDAPLTANAYQWPFNNLGTGGPLVGCMGVFPIASGQ